MDQERLHNLLNELKRGERTVSQVIDQLKMLPYEELNGFANF